jgi:phosphomethylpyrimidine synthase
MTQLEKALMGIVTHEMETVANSEQLLVEEVMRNLANGTIVIPSNTNSKGRMVTGIGHNLRTKINANIGTSPDWGNLQTELEKLKVSIDSGADTVMDLSTGGDLRNIRREITRSSSIPVGTVPIYQAAIEAKQNKGAIVKMTVDDLFAIIEEHAREGIDFLTVHCGLTRSSIDRLQKQGRITNVVSRGGVFMIGWMFHHEAENPLYQHFDRLLEICLEYDVTLSLGDGMRPGSLADATDRAQLEELLVIGELVDRSRKAGVQVMVEGPGHIPLNQIEANVVLQKSVCRGAPFYVLGPLVTDIAAGYDHITGAIGGAVAAMHGADFLCYVTPAEHLGLPTAEDVHQGIIATRIAAHAADITKGIKGAIEKDRKMAIARSQLDWNQQANLALDPLKASKIHELHSAKGGACSMCGDFCAIELAEIYLGITSGHR